jgi:hypothetical protein
METSTVPAEANGSSGTGAGTAPSTEPSTVPAETWNCQRNRSGNIQGRERETRKVWDAAERTSRVE